MSEWPRPWMLKTCAVLAAASMAGLLGHPALAGAPPSPADSLTGKLVITGASTLAPLIAEIGKRFEILHPAVRIDVQTGGSSRGIADVRRFILGAKRSRAVD